MALRSDSIGLFWEELPVVRGKNSIARVQPPIPETGWKLPKVFPNLSASAYLSIDLETKDPDLLTRGPGWARGVGHIVGIVVGADNGERWYFPMRHEVEPENNLDPETVLAWARVELTRPEQPKIGANITYDIGWLAQEGVFVQGDLHDVQFAEALLSERGDVNLDHLGEKYLGQGKETSMLYQWCADYYGGKPNDAQRANMYRTPARLAAPYALGDVYLPNLVLQKQWPLLQKEGLVELYRTECRLIPLLIAMRFAGVRVDVKRAEQCRDILVLEEKETAKQLRHLAGFEVNTNAAESIAKAFRKFGVDYPLTPKGAPSFTKDFLKTVTHPVAKLIVEQRAISKTRSTFIESYLLDANVRGKVYGSFHPLRADESGTRSGRFSSSDPNLQNLPSRDGRLGPLVRSNFVPDEGDDEWRKYDYSQIEYRFLAHDAVGAGSDEVRALFCNNPDTDYHEAVLDMVAELAGWDISTPALRKHWRKPVKNVNFGLIYGMGIDHLAEVLGMTRDEVLSFFEQYHGAAPFVKKTMEYFSGLAQRTGVVATILGRRSRFDAWEPARQKKGSRAPALPYGAAVDMYGQNVKRAHTHKALNRRLQGSAADMMKMAMLRCWEDGIFAQTGVPRLTVHDELDFSAQRRNDAAFREMQHVMETCLPLRVPVLVGLDVGPSWGECKAV